MTGWIYAMSFMLADSTYTRTRRAEPEQFESEGIEGM